VNAVVRIRDYQHGVLRIVQTTLRMTLARQVEAEWKRGAKVIAAEGEFQAAGRLSQATG
jgi:hypothetical protein